MNPEAAGLAALAAGGMDRRAQTRLQGLGVLDALPDHLLVHILSFLPAKQLCVVSCVSAALHVFAAVFFVPRNNALAPQRKRRHRSLRTKPVQEDELWLHLCLLGQRNELRFHYNWRYTCIQHTLGRSLEQSPEPASYPSARYQGILASWHLYCSWYRRHVDLGSFTVDNPSVQRYAHARWHREPAVDQTRAVDPMALAGAATRDVRCTPCAAVSPSRR